MSYRVREAVSKREGPVVVGWMGTTGNLEYLPRRHEVVAFCNHARSQEVFGSIPETSLEEGLQRMARWVRKVGSRERSEFTAIEITDQLSDSWSRQ